jgi:carboxyl-terminal processing protease
MDRPEIMTYALFNNKPTIDYGPQASLPAFVKNLYSLVFLDSIEDDFYNPVLYKFMKQPSGYNRKYFLIALSGVLVLFLSLGAMLAKSSPKDKTYSYLTIFSNVMHLVDVNYVEDVDFNKIMDAALYGMVENLDSESFFIKGKDLDDYKKHVEDEQTKAGVGITLAKRFGMITVIAVEKGSSADQHDIHAGDYVRSIDDQYVQALPLYKINGLMKGDPGSNVKITFFESALEKPKEFVLTRKNIARPYIHSYVAQPKIGYIRINHLLPGVETEIEPKLNSFKQQGVDKLILDLRGCADESHEAAVKVADLFLGAVPIVQISGRDGALQKISGTDKVVYKGELLVLSDYTTSGGAEILAGALQDDGAGKVYGIRTFGRGGIQKLVPAGENWIMLTTQKYLTPKGKVILNNGIDPAIAFHDDVKSVDESRDQDRMLQKAIETLRYPAAKKAA